MLYIPFNVIIHIYIISISLLAAFERYLELYIIPKLCIEEIPSTLIRYSSPVSNSCWIASFNVYPIPYPNLTQLNQNIDLIYKSNEYMGYYKKEIYFNLIPKLKDSKITGILKLTFTSSIKNFNIEKAMHLINNDEMHNVSVTFMLYNEGNNWDTERYNYTLWKNKK